VTIYWVSYHTKFRLYQKIITYNIALKLKPILKVSLAYLLLDKSRRL